MTTKKESEMTPPGRIYWRNKLTINGVAIMVLINIAMTIYFGARN